MQEYEELIFFGFSKPDQLNITRRPRPLWDKKEVCYAGGQRGRGERREKEKGVGASKRGRGRNRIG